MITANKAKSLVKQYHNRQKKIEGLDKLVRRAALEGLSSIPINVTWDNDWEAIFKMLNDDYGYTYDLDTSHLLSSGHCIVTLSWIEEDN